MKLSFSTNYWQNHYTVDQFISIATEYKFKGIEIHDVHAVTEGREAVGSSVVRLRCNGKLYSGKGVSTDIIGAGIRAYVDALNKICHEENENK